MCGTAFQFEYNEGNSVHLYDSLEDIKKHGACWEECGIISMDIDENNNLSNVTWECPEMSIEDIMRENE